MIVFSWTKDSEYWGVMAHLSGGPDDLKIPDLRAFGTSRVFNKAVAYALEDLAQKLKEFP